MIKPPEIYIIAGAQDTGKSTTLGYLDKEFGYATVEEAFKLLRKELGEECFFHDPSKPFLRNDSPDHVCPACRPKELTSLLLKKQLEIEKGISGRAIIERGFCDYLAALRFLKVSDWANQEFTKELFAKYKLVFLMDVMSELQEPKFGKSAEQRTKDAIGWNEFIFQEYFQSGFKVIMVPGGTIEDRASLVDSLIKRDGCVPFFGTIVYDELHENILEQIRTIFYSRGLSGGSLLFRITGHKHMMKLLRYGTDRVGFGKEVEDMIYASTQADVLRGIKDKDFNTAFKKIPVTQEPYILVYDAEKFGQFRSDRQYVFLNPEDKLSALICILKVKGA